MSGDNKTPDERAYDSLIKELGLDIDLDAPIGTGDLSDGDQDDDDAAFEITDREAVADLTDEPEAEDGGVELSEELLAELRSVIGGDAELADSDDAMQSAPDADMFGARAEEAPPLPEDPFTLEPNEEDEGHSLDIAPDEASAVEAEDDLIDLDDMIGEVLDDLVPSAPDVEDVTSTDDDFSAPEIDADSSEDEAVEAVDDAPQFDADVMLDAEEHPEQDIAVEPMNVSEAEPCNIDEVDEVEEDGLGDTAAFSAAIDAMISEEAASREEASAASELEALSDEPVLEVDDVEADDDADEDAESGLGLGFDAGVVLREALAERQAEERPKFDVSNLIQDTDDAAESEDDAEDEIPFQTEADLTLDEVLSHSFGDEDDDLAPAAETAELGSTETPPIDSGLDYDDAPLDSNDPLLDRFMDEDLELTSSTAEDEAETPPPPIDEPEEDVEYSFALYDEGGDRLVPRISLHAFCQTAPVTQLMMTMRNDRRMANVSMEVHQGGSRAAFDYYADRQTPHLIIIETTGKPARILAELDELAERCDENVKVIVIGQANDIRLYRELMHRGVSEYVVPPMEPVQVIRSISNLFVDPEQPFVGKSIAVTGVKGGVGSSTLAHNLAWTMSDRLEANTTLVDLDLNFGTTGLDFNQESQQTIADAILSPDRFDEAVLERLLTKATDHLSLFTAPATLDRTYDLDEETFDHVMGLVRQSVPFVVMDLPHIWADWFKSAVVGSDEIVVVAQPDLASLRNGKNLLDFLKAARPNDAPPRLVVNNVGVPRRPEIPVKDFAAAIGVEPELVLPFDPQLFGTAANNGQMISDVAPESKCSQGIDYLAGVLTGRSVEKPDSGSIINKLFKR